MAMFKIFSAPMPTTSSLAVIATGTNIKTLLQVKPSATLAIRLVEWGISFEGYAAAQPIKCELIETDVAATVTAHVAAGIQKYDALALAGGDPTTNLIQVGTSATGYNSSNEGSITDVRVLDAQMIAPTNQFLLQFPLGRECILQKDKYARIRVKAAADVNAYCYLLVEV